MAKTTIPWPVYPTGVPGWWMQEPASTVARAPLLPARSFEDPTCTQDNCTMSYKYWTESMSRLYNTFNGTESCRSLEKNSWCSFNIDGLEVDCWKDLKKCEFHIDPNGLTAQMACDEAPANINDCDFSYPDGHTESVNCDKKKDICKVTKNGSSALVKGILRNPAYWLTVVVLVVSVV